MAKKRRRPGASGGGSPETGFPAGPALAAGLLVGAGLTWLVMKGPPGEGPRPAPPTATVPAGQDGPAVDTSNLSHSQAQGVAMLQAQINAQLEQFEQNPDRIPAEDEDQRMLFRHQATGRWVLLLGRTRAEKKSAWTASILRDGPDSLTGERPEKGLAVDASFELPGAEGIETVEISATGSVVLVLTRRHFRGQGPGDLIRLVPGEGHGRVIDHDVFRFSLARDGDALLYERAASSDELHGKREVKLFHASRSETKQVREFEYPKVQVGELGPWDDNGVFVNLSIVEYAGGFEPSKIERFKLDGFNPTQLIPSP